mmetsp:Transcript_15884/g.15844  ORF Transcript_15884/g.15844 Transcript_15884/m.15844 type:complete len:94 (-) Transcript_15884:181-462(-)
MLKEFLKKGARPEGDHAKKVVHSPIVVSGTKVEEGRGTMLVIAVGANKIESHFLTLAPEQEYEMTPLEEKLKILADKILWLALIAGSFVILIL